MQDFDIKYLYEYTTHLRRFHLKYMYRKFTLDAPGVKVTNQDFSP